MPKLSKSELVTKVTVASGGFEALLKLSCFRSCLLILDITMHDMKGCEVC